MAATRDGRRSTTAAPADLVSDLVPGQVPITPPSRLRMTTVAERGRPAGSKSGQLLTARGLSGVGLPHAVVVSPGCWTLTNMVRWSGVVMTPVISHPRG